MAAPREPIFAALFAIIEGIDGFEYTSRVWQAWDDVPPAVWPAALLVKANEEVLPVPQGMPQLWRLWAKVLIYAKNDLGRNVAGSVVLNPLITAIEEGLERKPIEPPPSIPASFLANPPGSWGTSLGGLCYGCQIAGQIDIFEGAIGDEAMAIIPIEILTSA